MTNLNDATKVIDEVDKTIKEVVKKDLMNQSNLFYLSYPSSRMQTTRFALAVTETEVIMFNPKYTEHII